MARIKTSVTKLALVLLPVGKRYGLEKMAKPLAAVQQCMNWK